MKHTLGGLGEETAACMHTGKRRKSTGTCSNMQDTTQASFTPITSIANTPQQNSCMTDVFPEAASAQIGQSTASKPNHSITSLSVVPPNVRGSKRVQEYYSEIEISNFSERFRKQPKITKPVSADKVCAADSTIRPKKRKAKATPQVRHKKVRSTSDNGWRGASELPRVLAALPPVLKQRFTALSSGRPPDQ